jgi:hypothetical protein
MRQSVRVGQRDAFMFGVVGDTSWSLTGQSFEMSVKASRDDVAPLVTFASPTTIIVDDVVQRVIHMNVSEAALNAALPCGEYVYDLIMFDASAPPIRVQLMQGKLFVKRGVTES